MRSNSWSSNICGIKKWTLFPPHQEEFFKDSLNNKVYDIRSVDNNKFPNFSKAKRFIVYQHAGETLFVPSGWYHQTENIGDTISINHNWANSTNLDLTYSGLREDLDEIEYAIRDVKEVMGTEEFVQTCQTLLMTNSGWNWTVFWKMVKFIGNRLLRNIETNRLDKHGERNNEEQLEEKADKVKGDDILREGKTQWKVPDMTLQPPIVFILERLRDVASDFLCQSNVCSFLVTQFSMETEETLFGIVEEIDRILVKLKQKDDKDTIT
ncbi:4031_t:CDS:1 [Paraglomus occultum]|uniref:4031_t:CDS:1 n=1 Tax=Paraglomus occultum TaxID=144539 RepID=A0A9N9F4E3_9GLOM|nr:4031_t:CDS:1 [Paraglomus occultum]